jgi:hypothetical protein
MRYATINGIGSRIFCLVAKAMLVVDARDLKCLATPERSHLFGKRDLAFGINLPERSEIWKTFLRGV